MFEKLIWKKDRMLLNNVTYRLQHYKNDNWDGGDNHFILYKIKKLVDQYDKYFASLGKSFTPKNVLEIGMWDGGSLVFWNEILQPDKIVGIDIIENGGNEYFKKYIKQYNSNGARIVPYWSTDQADRTKLKNIIFENFGNTPIDLVFDDGSHMYKQTLESFNIIFPYLKKGGIYIIEDWAWSHWKELDNGQPIFTAPSKLIQELVQASGNEGLIESLTVFEGFVAIKKGDIEIENKDNFQLHNYIYNKPLDFKTQVKNALSIFGLYKWVK